MLQSLEKVDKLEWKKTKKVAIVKNVSKVELKKDHTFCRSPKFQENVVKIDILLQ